ncbi:MAG: tRNA (adenosine(37)-N6)-threonylcarbamoyltransferase complex ATPase subunit type 1 TsaE [Thermoanaerobaculia bacterium]|nr:tRNA (adenosine(37)-N6)-threonylcarbamoyltransferase complex ATPase subunit type 1 TsaE [Thermoanaerobaculia bacterium]
MKSEMRRWVSASPEATEAVGEELALLLAPDGVLLLRGDLAAGKTVLARGVARSLGIEPEEIQSPSYTLIHEHVGRDVELVHVDLYRLGAEEVHGLGLEEILARPSVKIIEWPDRLPYAVPGALDLTIRVADGGEREITLHPAGK